MTIKNITKAWLFCIVLLLLNTGFKSQESKQAFVPTEVKANIDAPNKKVNVEFKVDTEQDLLVIVTDSSGITIFLENQFRFKGVYKKSIDLPGRGKFNLNVIKENEKINKSLFLK